MPRGKGEGSLAKDKKTGLWTARVELPPGPDGKRRRKVIRRKDKKQAMDEMDALKSELKKHGNLPTSSLTVGRWLRYWIDELAPQDIRPKSYASYKSTVDGWLIPLLGRHKVDSLTADHVRDMFKAIQSTPKSYKLRGQDEIPEGAVMVGADTAIKAHAVLSSALKTAMREGRATRNVCEMVDPPRKAKVEQAARVAGTLDLSWQLLRITDISTAPADYEYRRLEGTLYLTRPKSKSGWREIPLVDPLKSILELHLQGRKTGLVFTNDGRPWDPDAATKAWAKLLAKAGMPSNVVLHGARHTTVDLLDAAGVDWDTIKDIVGHSTTRMSKAYRSKPDMKRLTVALEQLSKMLEPT
jgi:integrase